ncbi:MAG: hypothetical protein IJU19_06635 [Bacteroidales bacterium]|nr:hypothetical protein [Bacteroidales bacterium]
MTETFDVQSDIACLPLVEERLFCFCDEYNLVDAFPIVSTATLHAVENAIVNRNCCNAQKRVHLYIGTWGKGIFVEVADDGDETHDNTSQIDWQSDKMLGSEIFLMHSLADRVIYLDEGRTVRLEFVIGGIDTTLSLTRTSVLNTWLSHINQRQPVA